MIPWITVEDADAYFETRLNSARWTSATDAVKAAALMTAQARIERDANYAWPLDSAGEGVAPTQSMADAVCEQALFFLNDADIERRISLQLQGVRTAGIVQEMYAGVRDVPLAPGVEVLLVEYLATGAGRIAWER